MNRKESRDQLDLSNESRVEHREVALAAAEQPTALVVETLSFEKV